jgi:hypothetical protein
LKKKRIIPNTVLPLPNKNQNVRLSALFRPSIICPKNVTDSPMCIEMLAYGKFVDMVDQGHFTEDEIEAMDEQHRKKMDECKKDLPVECNSCLPLLKGLFANTVFVHLILVDCYVCAELLLLTVSKVNMIALS